MDRRTVILGISCFYHDSAAALVVDGVVVAAAQEERFTRKKHDSDFPAQAIEFCLQHEGLSMRDVQYVVFYEKPLLKLERLIKTYIGAWPRGLHSFLAGMPPWTSRKMWIEYTIRKELDFKNEIFFTEHHYAHAASAYYCSNFDSATIITIDGVGERDTTTIGYAESGSIVLTHSIEFPHSIGLLYSAITSYLGFMVNSDEYKVMGLAPYGNPKTYEDAFKKLADWRADGSFKLDMRYFAYEYGLSMISLRLVSSKLKTSSKASGLVPLSLMAWRTMSVFSLMNLIFQRPDNATRERYRGSITKGGGRGRVAYRCACKKNPSEPERVPCGRCRTQLCCKRSPAPFRTF